MTDSNSIRLTATLEQIKEQHAWTAMPRLVKALEAVLKEHRQGFQDDNRFCSDCLVSWPCPTVRAIVRELNGDNGGDD